MDQIAKVQSEFTKQAAKFNHPAHTIGSAEVLEWILTLLPTSPQFQILDAATGTALLGRALAPQVKEVIALDTTPSMIEEGMREAQRLEIDNISFKQGIVEEMPFPSESFDMVVSRLAIHHFSNPKKAIREMSRVCKQIGSIYIIDLIAPEDPTLSTSYNEIETLRDPSHTRALSYSEFQDLASTLGLSLKILDAKQVVVDFDRWVDLTATPEKTSEQIKSRFISEINGGSLTGCRPHYIDKALMFLQTWAILKVPGTQL